VEKSLSLCLLLVATVCPERAICAQALSIYRAAEIQTQVRQQGSGHAAEADIETYLSSDRKFETGIYRSGPIHETLGGPDGYPNHESFQLLSGEITMTSSNGTPIVLKPGDSVTIPQGWTGRFESEGYVKMYNIYYPSGMPN